MERETESW